MQKARAQTRGSLPTCDYLQTVSISQAKKVIRKIRSLRSKNMPSMKSQSSSSLAWMHATPSANCRWQIRVVLILSHSPRTLTAGRFGNNTMTSPPIVQYQIPFHPLQPLLAVSGEIILYPATTSPVWMLKDILISMQHLERHLDSPIHTRPDMLAQAVRTPSILVVVGVC